ncbi:MAG: cell division protein FtsK [Planctomycetes bacterium SCN 63-9]|nr:MAG: cell division protein FtsK [Planctomycetes bacterium SCN 63-9]
MPDRQQRLHAAPQLMFCIANFFLALSLAGYDPADAPGWGAEPARQIPDNPCGPVGATLAHLLFTSMGWATWVAWLALVAVNILYLARRKVTDRAVPALGLGLVIAAASGFIQHYAPAFRNSPPIGSGGYLGALLDAFLEGQFGPAGLLLILSTAALFGLVLCYEVLYLWPAQAVARFVDARLFRRGARTAQAGGMVMADGRSALGWEGANALPGPVAFRPAMKGIAEPAPAGIAVDIMPSMHGTAALGFDRTVAARAPQQGGGGGGSGTAPRAPLPPGAGYIPPSLDLLDPPAPFPIHEHEEKIHARALQLERTLLDFNYQVRVVQIDTGPVITQFEIELEAGLRVSRIMSLADDLAIALAVPSVRIVAPIPGKNTVGIEVPNERRGMVRLGDVITGIQDQKKEFRIPLFLGKDVKGVPLAFDLADMPHLLIAGRTGTGKSVCLNAMILSILMTKRPDEVKMILIDPKMVELSQFKKIPHLMNPVVTDMKKAESILAWACDKMDERYGSLARASVRNVQAFNQLSPEEIYERMRPEDDEEKKRIPTFMPYIVIIADEMADLMMTAAKEVEQHIVRLAQKARAAGIHLILATQRPTVDVITGLIKANMPARIGFQVTSRNDSRVILDEIGADRLLGNGDMLFLVPGTSHIVRSQGTYVSDKEVAKVCDYLEQFPQEFSRELVQMQVGGPGGKNGAGLKERDELYEPAIEVVIREGRGSTSLLQRALGIGYGRAARIIDYMAEDGIVGEFKSGSAREVLYTWEEWEAMKNGGGDDSGGVEPEID